MREERGEEARAAHEGPCSPQTRLLDSSLSVELRVEK